MSVKIIVSNKSALQRKYGTNVGTIFAALPPLVAADRNRNIITTVVYMDDPVQMAQYKAPPITNAGDPAQTKLAIDALYNSTNADYITILGAPDVVAMVPLTNGTGDKDPNVPSDLPYACNAGYSLSTQNFLAPTRVVGRLPDITGQSDPNYLARLIQYYVSIRPQARAAYSGYLGITCAKWTGSTTMSLNNIFGNATAMYQSPPSGPNWSNADYANRSHFVNCHGGPNSPIWTGQLGNSFPNAVVASNLNGKLTAGTIATAECCYGAQLYNPAPPGQPNYGLSICNTYLQNGVVSFFGSTNIAYGPFDTNDYADYITQYFLINMLGGATAGSAALQARQQFVRTTGPVLSAINLKTLAQFYLLGDASAQPVAAPAPKSVEFEAADDAVVADRATRSRRVQFHAIGRMLAQTTAYAVRSDDAAISPAAAKLIEEIVAKRKLPAPAVHTYDTELPADARNEAKAMIGPLPRIYEVRATLAEHGPFVDEVVFVIHEIENQVVAVEELYRR